ncbi:MAG: hypothetical protein L0I76_05185 [Pseudonocardia sp.]|nr:hypothetical protein [Pseudonocardia sp.]
MSVQFSVEPVSPPQRRAGVAGPGLAPAGTAQCLCVDLRWRSHHDRLLRVEADPDELLELLELAVTWGELDYSGTGVVPPEHWGDFALAHDWQHPERMERLFGLAADIALRPGAGAGSAAGVLHLLGVPAGGR